MLDFIDIDHHKILGATRNLNPNKAHGCNDISIRMLKICDDSIVLPFLHTDQILRISKVPYFMETC